MSERAAILTVGSELLRGDGLDTNSQWLSRRLETLGYSVVLHLSCLDDEDEIARLLSFVAASTDLVVVTGGLGPTVDDVTRAAVAQALKVPLEIDEGELRHIEELFARFGRSMSPSNRRQAELPQGATVLRNEVGTAPAFRVSCGEVPVYVLPGVPREMKWLWDHYLRQDLIRGHAPRAERTFRTVGIGESRLGERLAPVEALAGVEVRYAAEEREGTVRVTLLASTQDEVQAAWEAAREAVGETIACIGPDLLQESVVAALCAQGLTLTTAESCTGGRVAARIVQVPGASQVFERGLVTYSNQAKSQLLGIAPEVIETHGAVSEVVARAMARGAREAGNTRLGVAITGIAGPGGGSNDKPVGTVHLAVAYGPKDEDVLHQKRRYPGTREMVQVRSAAGALKLVLDACVHLTNTRC
jgi:nicotinamide-nucleotide amidase